MDKIGFNRNTYNLIERGIRQIERVADELERHNDLKERELENNNE